MAGNEARRDRSTVRAVWAVIAVLAAAGAAMSLSAVGTAGAQKTKGNSPEFVANITSPAKETGTYGAIVLIDRGAVVYAGLAFGARNRATAERLAEQICSNALAKRGVERGQACSSQVWFYSNCGSFATSNHGSWGTGYGSSPAEACRQAQASCSDYSKGCEPGLFVCSPSGKNGTCDGKFTQYQ